MFFPGYFPVKYQNPGIKKAQHFDSKKKSHHHKHHHTDKQSLEVESSEHISKTNHSQEFGYHSAEDYAKILGEGQAAQAYVNESDNMQSNTHHNMQSGSHHDHDVHMGRAGIPGCGTASHLDYPHTGHGQHYDHHKVGMHPNECPGKDLLHMSPNKVGIPGCGTAGGFTGENISARMNSKNVPMNAQDTTDPEFGPQSRNIPGAGRMDTGIVGGSMATAGANTAGGQFDDAKMNSRNVPMGGMDTTDRAFGGQETANEIPGAGRMGNNGNGGMSSNSGYNAGNVEPNVMLNSTHPKLETGSGAEYETTGKDRKISVGSFEDRHDNSHAYETVEGITVGHPVSAMPPQQQYNYIRAESTPRSHQHHHGEHKTAEEKKPGFVKKVEQTLHIGGEK